MAEELKNVSIDNHDDFKEAVADFLIERKGEGVEENTVRTYTNNLKKIISINRVKTLAQVALIPSAQIKNSLKDVGTPASRSGYLNALISVLKLYDDDEIDKAPDFKKTVSLNSEMGRNNQTRMDDNEVEDIVIPDDFDDKIEAYMKKNKGTRNAVVVALFGKAPPIRAHVLENCLIARSKRENAILSKPRKNSVMYVDMKTRNCELFVPAQLNKVKKFDFLSVYVEADVREQLVAYISKHEDNTYLFENQNGTSLKVQSIDILIKDSFKGAGLGSLGTQKLRRMYSTRTQSNPMLTKAQKEINASRMNHSIRMDMAYAVKSFVIRTREGDAIVQELGKEIERYVLKISNIADIVRLKDELTELKGFVDEV